MKLRLAFVASAFMFFGPLSADAQVVLPPKTCKMTCGETVIYEFTCTSRQICCALGSCTGEWAGTCCPSSPQWCCFSDIVEGDPVAFCVPCDPA
jgi:hypothetical protein